MNDGRASEEIALEQIKTEFLAKLHLFRVFDLFGQQGLAEWLESGHQLLETVRFDVADVDLDDLRQFQQRTALIKRFGAFPDGKNETGAAQRGAAGQHFFALGHRVEDFKNDGMWWQRRDQFAGKQALVDLDESLVGPQRTGHREFGKSIGNDRGGRLVAIDETGEIAGFCGVVAEQQLIGEQLLVAIENRLTTQKDFLLRVVWHGDPSSHSVKDRP